MLKMEEIHELIKRIDESSIDEFTYETNGTKIALKKNKGEVVSAAPQALATPAPAVQQQAPVENKNIEDKANDTSEAVTQTKNYDYEIVSPMVGTFYSSPSPDKDAYVKKGDTVSPDTIVCIVEAMKLFNEIEADVKGEIVEILVDNGELVEYGQPLFRVQTV